MGLLDALFGRKDDRQPSPHESGRADLPDVAPARSAAQHSVQRPQNADEQAIARYHYMIKTAPPEEIERAHEEAFAKLTPQQRQMVLQGLSSEVPESERASLSDDPQSLARAATRAQMRDPNTMDRALSRAPMGGMGGGMMGGMGGMLAGSLMASMAGAFIGTSIAGAFFSNPMNEGSFQDSPEASAVDGGVDSFDQSGFQETGLDASADPHGDPGAADGATDSGSFESDGGGFADGGFADSGFDMGGFDM